MVNCIEQMSFSGDCSLLQPLDVLKLPHIIYNIPNAVTLGIFLIMLIAPIYIWSRNLVVLAVLGIYSITIVSTTWAAETVIAPAYQSVTYIIALSIASLITMLVLKTLRE